MFCNTIPSGCAIASMPATTCCDDMSMPGINSPGVVCVNADVVVPAGEARTQPCDEFGTVQPMLARIQFPIQQYQSGFCPCEALETGTLFPELMS